MQAVKVGRSKDPKRRMESLQTAHPAPLQLLGVIDEDKEQQIHGQLAAHRKSGEWFAWNEQTRGKIRQYLAVPLPPVQALRKAEAICLTDWVIEAEQLAGEPIEKPEKQGEDLNSYELLHTAACELEGRAMEEYQQKLIECELESFMEFDALGFQSSEEWAENEMEVMEGYCPVTECDEDFSNKYLIGLHISDGRTTKVDMFWQGPLTDGGRKYLEKYLCNVAEWSREFWLTEFRGWVWNKTKQCYELWEEDMNRHLHPLQTKSELRA